MMATVTIDYNGRMLMLYFVCAIVLSLANAQLQDDDYIDSDSNEVMSYGNGTSCIRRYRDLQSYVLNNEDLIDDLTELFFKTGKAPTEFVLITYSFKVLLSTDNSTNSTNNTLYDDEFTCMDNQKMFIRSSSALYLLGPKALFWQTLFAVHVQESSITINLPCLCNDAYDNLLSRLTYLVSGS